jgi:hypothetical protein
MIKIEFSNCSEIRMGSPYQVCTLNIDAEWGARLGERDWQDRAAHSPDGRFVGLVYWDILNSPGFRIMLLDTKTKRVNESERIAGCCDSITWKNNGISYQTSDGHECVFRVE